MKHISIHIATQTLSLFDGDTLLAQYPISSAKNGLGSEEGSYKTPLGNFTVCEKFGDDQPIFTTFKAREATGIWSKEDPSTADLILSRILWLDGSDPENSNTKQRYIYIHGTNHEDLIGSPHSCGCIRMKNADIIELFDQVPLDTPVQIS